MISHTLKKIRGKKYNKITSQGVEAQEITFGVEVKRNEQHYNFTFNGISSDEAALEALDKILLYLNNEQTHSPKTTIFNGSGLPDYIVNYDERTKLWIAKGIDEIIIDKINKQ